MLKNIKVNSASKAKDNVKPLNAKWNRIESSYFMVKVPLTSVEMENMFGPEPEVLDAGCPACDAWRAWGRTGCVELEVHREKFLRAFNACSI